MQGRNLESFMADQAAFDALSDDDKARLFAGESIEGETETAAVEESSATPDAATVTPPNEDSKQTVEPVVLTKDGQHTIPFSVLEAERERARQLEQQVQELKSAKTEQPAAQEATQTTDDKPADTAVDLSDLVRQRDEALYSGDADKAHELSMKIISIQNQEATNTALAAMEAREAKKTAQEKQRDEVSDALGRANALVEKYPFLNPDSQNANQVAIDLVVAQRDALMRDGVSFGEAIEQAVAKVAPLFVTVPTPNPGNTDAAAKAAEVIAKAQTQTPTSLSQAPAGAVVHHDQGEAIRDSDGLSLLAKFDGKSADEIMKLVSRVI